MKKRKLWIILTIAVIVLSFTAVATVGLLRRGRIKKIAQSSSPTVQIAILGDEDLFAPGSEILVLVSAFGRTPIANIQLWMDGQLIETQSNGDSFAGTFNAEFKIAILKGQHILTARALDAEGLIGQTLPVHLAASTDVGGEVAALYKTDGEETLEDIAEKVGFDQEDLEEINPDLDDGDLPAGTNVKLPAGDLAPQAAAVSPPSTNEGPVPPPNTPMLAAIANYNPPAKFSDLFGSARALLPEAPDGLQASVENCQMTLTWFDQSDNEDAFNIWISGTGIPVRLIGTASSGDHVGQVWYQVPSPTAGIYSVWIEAVNAYGTQPAEPVWLGVPAQQCAHFTATYLQMEIKKISFFGPTYDRFYTYISVEGNAERRFPTNDSDFMLGSFDQDVKTEYILLDRNIFTIPIPSDGQLDMDFKGMGWSGDAPYPLGKFPINIPSSMWDGSDLQISSQDYEIILSVQPFGQLVPQGTATFFNPTLPKPYDLEIQDTGFSMNPHYPTDKFLSWNWDGTRVDITGFTIYLDGKPFMASEPQYSRIIMEPPVICGDKDLILQVAANTETGESEWSEPAILEVERCRVLAEVELHSMQVFRSPSEQDDCEPMAYNYVIYGASSAESSYKPKPPSTNPNAGSRYPWILECNDQPYFKAMGFTNKIYVPIDPVNPQLVYGMVMETACDLGSCHAIWVKEKIKMSLDQWKTFDSGLQYYLSSTEKFPKVEVIMRIRGVEDIGIYR